MIPDVVKQWHIFFDTQEWAWLASVFHYNRLEGLVRDKHSSLLGLCINYKENELMYI
jgi:hypothetical protein